MSRRKSPTEQEADRVAEALFNSDPFNEIVDIETFDEAYDDYFDDQEHMQNKPGFKREVFRHYQKLNKNVSKGKSIFKKAGGKDFSRDRLQTAETVVTTEAEYKKKGSSNVDLKGYDTKKKKKKHTYSYYGKQKNKIVYARRTYVTINKKRVERYRDKKGRFTKIK